MKAILFFLPFLLCLSILSCKGELMDDDVAVHWTNVPKRQYPHDTIRVNLPAQGDTLEYIGNNARLWFDRYRNYGLDTVIEHYDKWQDTISSDTAIYKNIMIVLQRIEAQKATKLKIMARQNTTHQKIRLRLNVQIFPMYTDPFLITQEPMTSTKGKNSSVNNMK